MLPNFLVEEQTVRESGESAVFEIGSNGHGNLILTLGITHAVERQTIHLEIHGSEDGEKWASQPLITFPPKCYCGEYSMKVPRSGARYVKAVWRIARWARGGQAPYCRLYVFADVERAHGPMTHTAVRMAGAA